MKKKISVLITLVLVLSMFIGCTSNQIGLLDEIKKTESWEASSTKLSMDMSLEIYGESIDVSIQGTGFSNIKDQTASVDMVVKSKDYNLNIPVKMYVNKNKIYINKEYFSALADISGAPAIKINALNADYIMIDMASDAEYSELLTSLELVANSTSSDITNKLMQDIATDVGLDIPITKEGNTYKITLTSDQLVDVTKKVVDTSVSKLGELNKKYKLGLNKSQIDEVVKGYNSIKPELDEMLPEIKKMVQGSYLDFAYTVEEDKVKETAKMVFKAEDVFNLSLNMSAESAKEEPKAIAFPEKVITLSLDKLEDLFVPSSITINVSSGTYVTANGSTKQIKVIKEKGKVYLPIKQVLAEFGYQVAYDQKAKKVYVTINNQKVIFNTITKNGVAYVTLDELVGKNYFDGYLENNLITLWSN